jgi:hypothetical protein
MMMSYFKFTNASQGLMTSGIQRSLRMTARSMIPFILITTLLFIVYFFAWNSEFITFAVFMILIPIFAIFKYDGRIPIAYAIALLIFTALLTFIKKQNVADQLAIFSYWLLVVGTSCLLIELFRKNLLKKDIIDTQ